MKNKLDDLLRSRVLVFDGAMGTELYRRGFFLNTSYEGLCLSHPQVIADVHHAYIEAGCDVLTTNSFGANTRQLGRFGMAERSLEINRAAARLARQAAGEEVLVAGSVGPVGSQAFGSSPQKAGAADLWKEQIGALAEGGADFVLFETLASATDVGAALEAMQSFADLPFALSFKIFRNAETATGETLEHLLAPLHAAARAPSALGLNCGEGAESLLAPLERLRKLADYPLIVQPNAGVPKVVDGRTLYMASPEYLTTYALRYVKLGARAVGGCCGTGPGHIRELARGVRPMSAAVFSRRLAAPAGEAPAREAAPMRDKSLLGERLASGKWVSTVELVPPRGYDLDPLLAKARLCRANGVHAINIPDGPRASARLSPLVTAEHLLRKAGIEPILHFCCRDRNLIGMQADLLGCAAAGIRNLLFITGDPPKLGDYPTASAVFDADSIAMVRAQQRLNRGMDIGAQPIGEPTRALIGVGADPNAIDLEQELDRLRRKAEAGAEFIITQPVFDAGALLSFLERIDDLSLPVLAGIWPLASYRNAEFMRNEVPGVVVPDAVMERMAQAKTREAQREEGIRIATEALDRLRGRVAGAQVSAPFGRAETALAVLRASNATA